MLPVSLLTVDISLCELHQNQQLFYITKLDLYAELLC